MRQMKRESWWRVPLLSILVFHLAGFRTLEAAEPFAENHFQKGVFESSLGSGVLFSPFASGLKRPTIDYTLTEIQVGYMLTDTCGPSFWRGNFETAVSAFGGGIFEGNGNYIAGATLWLRHNFVLRGSRFVPFAQAGAGLTETDLDRQIEGQNFNFNLNLGAGVRYFLKPNCSLALEYRYQHISDANLSPRNEGVNAHGPVLSVSYFF